MNATWYLPAFYCVCGLLTVGLLIRIWMKNQAARRPAVARPRAESSPASLVQASNAATTPAVIPQSRVVSETETALDRTSAPAPAIVVTASPASVPATEFAASSPVPVPYVSASQSTILHAAATPSWEDRRLFESHGILKRTGSNSMPSVRAADIPGVDDSDRVFGSGLNPAMASLLPDTPQRREDARRDLNAAGYYSPHAVENLAAVRYALIMLAILVFGGLLLIVPVALEPWAVAGLVAGPLLGWALPVLYVRRKAADRIGEIGRAMPDLLDMLNMCVSQGLTVPDSLQRILRDFRSVHPALSQELSIVTEQCRINDMQSALESFSRRINLPEVHSFTSLMIQSERMGTSISSALATYSDTMRESMKQRADEHGNRATFRLLFPTVLCLMPAVYLFLLGPAVNELSKFFNQGGRDALDSGSAVIQQLNANRPGITP
jgi:tight adherence protein C